MNKLNQAGERPIYSGNHEILVKEIEDNTNKVKRYPMFMDQKN